MSELTSISIIIPTFNEEVLIERLCSFLSKLKQSDRRLRELIVVDANSTDNTQKIVATFDAKVILSDSKSRAVQLNLGAKSATGNILYFVHADGLPPKTFIEDISNAISDGIDFGCFSYRFDHSSKLLKVNARFTRRDSSFIGGGDQTLFIKRSVFDDLGGFSADHLIMEDYDLYWRAKKSYRQRIITNDVLVSARKYAKNSYLRVQFANLIVFNGYKIGVAQSRLKNWYQKLLN